MRLAILALSLALGCAACGDDGADASRVALTAQPQSFAVASSDFAVLPCSTRSQAACALVYAGGKSLLFGAPAGVSLEVDAERLAALDSAFLFSMMPQDVEGLDEIRNRGWRAGRAGQLVVAGPEGTAGFLEAMNLAFEQPDALSFVEERAPRGGFVAALLQPGVEVVTQAQAFDTGDLKVSAIAGANSYVTYRIEYRDLGGAWHDLVLAPCGGPDPLPATVEEKPASTDAITCDGGSNARRWPVAEPFRISN